MKATSKKSAKNVRALRPNSKAAKKAAKKSIHVIPAEAKITKVVSDNPRRKGTFGHKSFSLIKNGMTVEQFTNKGGRRKDLQWDVRHGYLKVA